MQSDEMKARRVALTKKLVALTKNFGNADLKKFGSLNQKFW